MSKYKYNKSKTYLLPLLSEVLDINIKFLPYLLNTYMFDDNSEYKECFYILHEFSFKNPEFTSYEHKLINNEIFIKSIDLDNKVMYIFKFPEEYLNEYYCLKESKYSEFKPDAKELILRFWSEVYSGNRLAVPFLIKVKQILYKDKKLKEKIEKDFGVVLDNDQELGDFVNIEDETFSMKNSEQSQMIIDKQ